MIYISVFHFVLTDFLGCGFKFSRLPIKWEDRMRNLSRNWLFWKTSLNCRKLWQTACSKETISKPITQNSQMFWIRKVSIRAHSSVISFMVILLLNQNSALLVLINKKGYFCSCAHSVQGPHLSINYVESHNKSEQKYGVLNSGHNQWSLAH